MRLLRALHARREALNVDGARTVAAVDTVVAFDTDDMHDTMHDRVDTDHTHTARSPCLRREFAMSAPRLDVLFCDNHVLVVAKPACVPAVPDDSGDVSLYDMAKDWVRVEFAKPGDVFLGIVHRLDRPVSGVMAFARTSKGASRLSEQFRTRVAHKTYWGVGQGEPRAESGALSQWLVKDERTNRVRVEPRASAIAKQAITRWKVLERRAGRTLYELSPETGRPHQLRVAAASLGTPLLGDVKYGAREPLEDQSIALHAAALELEHPTKGERMRFTTPPPALSAWDFDITRRPLS